MTINDVVELVPAPDDQLLQEVRLIRIALEKLAKCAVPIDNETSQFLVLTTTNLTDKPG